MDVSIINTRIDHYLIVERVKAGGVAIVYRAIDERDNSPVAFKLLQTNWAEHDEVISRFEREARIMSQLHHPHIVRFRGSGIYEGRPYIVMDFMEGGSLSERLKRIAQISLGGTARLLAQIASALDYAHRKGIVHRDLKPGNILMRDERHAALTDFGIARGLEHTILTTTGQMPGTPHYMSPEQARGSDNVDYTSDLYSLGIITYLLTAGRLPFGGGDAIVIINQHMSIDPVIPREHNPELPPALDNVLMKALAKQPADRYRSAGGFADAFSHAIAGYENLSVRLQLRTQNPPELLDFQSRVFSSEADLPPSPDDFLSLPQGVPKERRGGRGGWAFGVIVGLLLLVVVGLGLFMIGSDNEAEPAPNVPGVAAATDEPTSTATATITPTNTQPQAAAVTAAATTAAPTVTATATPTASATATATPTTSATATATVTPSSTPSAPPEVAAPTAPPFASLEEVLLTMRDGTGSAGRFNCTVYVEAYEYLQAQVTAGSPEYESARTIIEDTDAAPHLIYEEFCQQQPEETEVFVEVVLVQDMRNIVGELLS
ncbi:MAG: serine/threonine-protein kinase [Chloroflexota bacterium]